MGIVDRPIAHLPSLPIHPYSRRYLRFCLRSQVFQFTSLHFGLATAPQVFTMIVKDVKLMALSLADQVPVSGGSPSEHSGSGRPNPVLGVDHKSKKKKKSELKPTQVFFVCGLRIPSRFSPVKPTQERWLNFRI